MKQVKKLLAIILVIATLIGVFSCGTSVFAEEYNAYVDEKAYEEKLLTESFENESEKAEIIGEVPEKRDEFSKTYKRADGSYTSIVSQVPLHKLENGQWNEIINTLQEDDGEITNENGLFDVTFPETIGESEKINISNGDTSLSFSVNGIEDAESFIAEAETENTIINTDLNKTISEITYEGISKNTDLKYVVSPTSVKENIVVYNKNDLKETYSFTIEKGDLSAKLDKENNLTFKNEKNETVFTIPAPVMTDADNAVSYDIDVSVKNANKETLTLTYTPSKEWLNTAKFPVVIDPVIMFDSGISDFIEDTVICYSTENPDAENETGENTVFGYVADVEETKDGETTIVKSDVLVKINTEAFASLKQPNFVVTDVNFIAEGSVADGNIMVKAINEAWNPAELTYRDVYPQNAGEPLITYGEEIIDYHTGVDSTTAENSAGMVAFNITKLFNEWLSGERSNNGFAIVAEEGANALLVLDGYIESLNGDRKTHFEDYIAIDYIDTIGRPNDFEYLNQEIGRAGTGSINTFARAFSLTRSDLALGGLRLDAEIGFNYNTALESYYEHYYALQEHFENDPVLYPSLYGKNWLPTYFQKLTTTLTEGEYLLFTGEGALVTFNQREKTVTEGETTTTEIYFEEEKDGNSGYTLELINPAEEVAYSNIKAITPDGFELYFAGNGFVNKIQNTEANADGTYDAIEIVSIGGSGFAIDYVEDSIGRIYDFVYDEEKILLTEIKCLTADGTPIKAGTTNVDLKVSYGYDSEGNLTSVTYPDGEIVRYTYDSNGNLIKAQNIDDYNIQYTYDASGKVTNVAEYADTLPGNTITLTQLADCQVKVVDDCNGTETYQFGKDGKLQYTFDEKGNYLKSDYAPANDENVYSSNQWSISSQNLLKNGSFEEVSALSNSRAKYWSNDFEIIDSPEQQVNNGENIGYDSATFGEKAYLISSENNCTGFVSQDVEISTTGAYTLSAFVRSETSGELTLKVTGVNASNVIDTWDFVRIDSTTGWERYSVTYKPSENFVPKEIKVSIGFEANKGTYYVDCTQLEKGLGTADFNLIENGAFNNSGEYWSDLTIVTDLLNAEPVKAVKLNGGLPYYVANNDTATLEDHISATTQNVKINGKKGDTYSIGGWFKGYFDDNHTNIIVKENYSALTEQPANSSAQIKVTYSYLNAEQENVTENFVLDFAPHNDNWQYAVDTFALKGDAESVDVTVMAKNVPNDSLATGIELTLDNNSFSFVDEDETAEEPEITDEDENNNADNPDTENATPEECPCEDCEELDCPCRCDSVDACTCVQCKRRSDIETTSEDGKTITTSSFDGEKYMQSAVTYSDDKNNIISETDENNISSGYAYNVNGSLIEFTDGANNKTTYQSNAMGYLTLAESNVSGLTDNAVKMAINYVYDGDLLTNVTEGNVQYTYEYDGWGQLKKVLVDGETLICYNYDENNNAYRTRIISIIFGSSENTGFTVEYTYDTNGNIVTVEKYRFVEGEKDSITYNYAYDNLGNLTSITDNGTGHHIQYSNDGIVIKESQTGSVIYEIKDVTPEPETEEDNTTEGVAETDDTTPEIVSITQETAKGPSYNQTSYNHKIYESDYSNETGKSTEKEAVSVVTATDENGNFTYGKTIGTQTLSDWFGRNEAVTVMTKDPVDTSTDFASISSQFGYVTNGNVTTNLISSVTNTVSGEETNTVNYNYTYDSNGRITNASTVSSVQNFSGASQYIYDEAGQLIKEITGSTTYEYAYDSKGNISSRKVYSGETLVSTDTFTYGANTWEDRLTVYNNKTITYDSIGNPTSYLGATLSWRGRELAGYSKGNKQISYSYDVDGMRYRKVVKTNGVETACYDYVYSDGTLILLTYTANNVSNTARFVYDSWGEPRGFMLNDSATYLYLKNAQGDITGIVDENGEIVVRYTYNAWGAVDFVVPFGVDPSASIILATVSPFTYRGYCYDYDIGMYYLQSRYYDPEICRFINADSTDYLGATGTLLSYNLFAYCENDGVNFVDETGTWAYDVHAGYYSLKQKEKAKVKVGYVIGKNGQGIPYYTIGKGRDEEKVYYGTYYWATECGIHYSNAKIIAFHCNDVDNQFSPLLANYQSWHFDTNYTANGSTDSRLIISFFMCLEASQYFDEALKHKKGGKKYKSAVKNGLMYLGYALHPIQDIYAHTPDRCHRMLVPYFYYYEDVNGNTISGSYAVLGWWHYPTDDTDNAQIRTKQVEKTKNHTYKILNTFVNNYKSILSRNNGVKI